MRCTPRHRAAPQRQAIVQCAQQMLDAAQRGHLDGYMLADHALDQVVHQASQNASAVKCVAPLVLRCRRFWYAYQHEGEMTEDARVHLQLAEGIATGEEARAVAGANALMDYLEGFARPSSTSERRFCQGSSSADPELFILIAVSACYISARGINHADK